MPIGGKFLSKYYNDAQMFPFEIGKIYRSNRESLKEYLGDDIPGTLTRDNAYQLFRNFIKSDYVPSAFTRYIRNGVIDKLDKGRYVVIVVSKCYSGYSNDELKYMAGNDNVYKTSSLTFMINSKMVIDLLEVCYKDLTPIAVIRQWSWEIHILKKN